MLIHPAGIAYKYKGDRSLESLIDFSQDYHSSEQFETPSDQFTASITNDLEKFA